MQFDFENIRVRSLNSIRTMNLFLTLIIGFIAMMSERKAQSALIKCIENISNRIYGIPDFDYYALAGGIYTILEKTLTGIKSFLQPVFKIKASQQLIMPQVLKLMGQL
ncbi:hypothetical protein [Clostridium sp. AWRP]|uniref:hypothetical protein n=1 Tax=Clostridium sp. AWRP TaxID=2212991 RepID=UPI000FD9FBB3|nr:hypothetical protein [Clostridium sp. AWRP]